MKKTLIIIALLIPMIFVTGCTDDIYNEVMEEYQNEQREKYTFVDEPEILTEGDDFFAIEYIVGTLKNESGKKTKYIQIVFNLYDEDGNVIGSAMDNINNIDPDGTWRFKAMILDDDFASFELSEITGF